MDRAAQSNDYAVRLINRAYPSLDMLQNTGQNICFKTPRISIEKHIKAAC